MSSSTDFLIPSRLHENFLYVLLHPYWLFPPALITSLKKENRPLLNMSLTQIFVHKNQILKLIATTVDEELRTSTIETVFREQTLCASVIQNFFKMTGLNYLKSIFVPLIEELITEKANLEIDSLKIKDAKILETNAKALIKWSQKFIDAVLSSIQSLPKNIHQVGYLLSEKSKERFGEKGESVARNTIVSLFILRFISLSLIQPNTLGFMNLDLKMIRNLILLAKVIQSASTGTTPINYMASVNSIITENAPKFDIFIGELMKEPSNKPNDEELDIPIDLNEACTNLIQFITSPSEKGVFTETLLQWVNNFVSGKVQESPSAFNDLNEISLRLRWITSLPEQTFELNPNSVSSKYSVMLRDSFNSLYTSEIVGPHKLPPSQFSSLAEWFQAEVKEHRFTIVLFYRGGWCCSCEREMQSWVPWVNTFHKLGGYICGISSEDIQCTKNKVKLNFETFSDESCSLANAYDLFIDTSPFFSNFGKYKAGVIQPAILVVSQSSEILYYWKSIPSLKNLQGAIDRPKPAEIALVLAGVIDISAFPSQEESIMDLASKLSDVPEVIQLLQSKEKQEFFRDLLKNDESALLAYQILFPRFKALKKKLEERKSLPKSKSILRLFGSKEK